MNLKSNYPLIDLNTFKMNVSSDYFLEYTTIDELKEFVLQNPQPELPVLHVGRGSNLLFINDFHGIVLHSGLRNIDLIDQDEEFVWLRAGSGVVWDELVEYTVSNSWYGIENLSLIPGEVGAAAVQNIGAYGVEFKDVVESVLALSLETGEIELFYPENCRYDYRESVFKNELKGRYAILSVDIKLSRKEKYSLNYGHLKGQIFEDGKLDLEQVRKTIIRIRNSKLPDPEVLGNAGSFFMNPVVDKSVFLTIQKDYPEMPFYFLSEDLIKIPAGWLIEKCGWKGKSLGNAGVHKDQALVLVNLGGAKPSEILSLASKIQSDVMDRFGIQLKPEVNYIG